MRDLAVAHIDLAASLANRFALALSVPTTLVESGNSLGGVTPAGAAFGDIRLGGLVRLTGQPLEDPISISAGLTLWLPTAGSTLAGDQTVRVAPRVVLAGLASKHLLWSASGAIQYREVSSIGTGLATSGNSVGTELQLGGALAFADLAKRYSVGPEAQIASVIVDGHVVGAIGVGSGTGKASVQQGNVTVSSTEDGLGVFGGLGYEFRVTPRFALGPQVNVGWMNLDSFNANWVNVELGFQWYFIRR